MQQHRQDIQISIEAEDEATEQFETLNEETNRYQRTLEALGIATVAVNRRSIQFMRTLASKTHLTQGLGFATERLRNNTLDYARVALRVVGLTVRVAAVTGILTTAVLAVATAWKFAKSQVSPEVLETVNRLVDEQRRNMSLLQLRARALGITQQDLAASIAAVAAGMSRANATAFLQSNEALAVMSGLGADATQALLSMTDTAVNLGLIAPEEVGALSLAIRQATEGNEDPLRQFLDTTGLVPDAWDEAILAVTLFDTALREANARGIDETQKLVNKQRELDQSFVDLKDRMKLDILPSWAEIKLGAAQAVLDMTNGILDFAGEFKDRYGELRDEGKGMWENLAVAAFTSLNNIDISATQVFDSVSAFATKINTALQNAVLSVLGFLGEVLGINSTIRTLRELWEKLSPVIKPILKNIGSWLKTFFHDPLSAISGFFVTIMEKAQEFGNWIKTTLTGPVISFFKGVAGVFGFGDSEVPSFQRGGIVPGAPGQPVPAILHGGERVIPVGGAGAMSMQPIIVQLVLDRRVIGEVAVDAVHRVANWEAAMLPGTVGA